MWSVSQSSVGVLIVLSVVLKVVVLVAVVIALAVVIPFNAITSSPSAHPCILPHHKYAACTGGSSDLHVTGALQLTGQLTGWAVTDNSAPTFTAGAGSTLPPWRPGVAERLVQWRIGWRARKAGFKAGCLGRPLPAANDCTTEINLLSFFSKIGWIAGS